MKKSNNKLPRWMRLIRLYVNDFLNLFFPPYYGDGSDLNEWDKQLNGYNDKKIPPNKNIKYDLEDMVSKITDENHHESIETTPMGKEVW